MGRPVESPSSDFTFGISDFFSGDIFINPGAAINVTYPDCCEDIVVNIWNVGTTHAITFKKPDTSTHVTLAAGEMFTLRSYLDTSGVPQYQTIQSYTPTNVTADRAYDANATTIDELADIVGTLISDLKARGVVD